MLRWKEQLDLDAAYAREVLVHNGIFMPMAAVHYDVGEVAILQVHWGSKEEKDMSTTLIRLAAVAYNADAVTFISEAWMRRVDRRHKETEAEYEARARAVPPSEAEDRTEALVITLCYRDDDGEPHSMMRLLEVIRGPDGKPTDAVAMGADDPGRLRGPLTELMPVRRPTAGEIAAAKRVITLLDLDEETQ